MQRRFMRGIRIIHRQVDTLSDSCLKMTQNSSMPHILIVVIHLLLGIKTAILKLLKDATTLFVFLRLILFQKGLAVEYIVALMPVGH